MNKQDKTALISDTSADAVLNRLKQAIGIKTDTALSKALNINRATLGNWRNRGAVPYDLCVQFTIDKGVSLDWLLIGRGPMVFGAEKHPTIADQNDVFRQQLFDGLSADQQQEVIRFVAEKKRLNNLEQVVQSLQLKVA